VIKTTGDKVLDVPLADVGGKGLFTKEIDDALLSGRVDIAVHSMKDVPTYLPQGTVLPCNLPREDTRDAFICFLPGVSTPWELPQGATVGSASLRRSSQLVAKRPDLKIVNFRGNVQSRVRKLQEGVVDCTLLAIAGLNRMDMAHHAKAVLSIDDMLPAIAQGAIGIACRTGDSNALELLSALNHEETHIAVNTERSFLAALDGSCRTPIAGLAVKGDGGKLMFRGLVASPDGKTVKSVRGECEWSGEAGVALGKRLGEGLKAELPATFFDNLLEKGGGW
jgi:hydroxymethylbilane synthase